jgi:hypothetical protein
LQREQEKVEEGKLTVEIIQTPFLHSCAPSGGDPLHVQSGIHGPVLAAQKKMKKKQNEEKEEQEQEEELSKDCLL